MNPLEIRLQKLNPSLAAKLEETKSEVEHLLAKYSSNFPAYTDHSIKHTSQVFEIASEVMTEDEIELLGADELYILSMACLLHDIGMCIPEEKIEKISNSEKIREYKKSHPNFTTEEFIRDIHHELSHKFIIEEWEALHIPTLKYAKAIGLIAEGHRKVDLGNFEVYNPQFFAKSGKEFVCLPYLACMLRIADELDVTNSRTPKLLTKYYMPNNEISIREWKKHIATSQRNYRTNEVLFEVDCSDQNIYAALQDQFDKIQNVINYCQKIIRAIPAINGKHYQLNLTFVKVNYNFIGFDPKGIKFSFDVQNVVTAFVGEDLYKDKFTSLREGIQNAIDSCRYKIKVLKEIYSPYIKVIVDTEKIIIEDNGAGMDEFIIENFFGRLASSFYEQEKIKSQFEAIGQFGVGVFSYFLLAEYIDIETKTANNNTLKFRFDKDPKSYFHFYDKVERNTPGTTIIMYLKKDLGDLIDTNVEAYIRKIFRHIEIPIELNILGNKSSLIFTEFSVNPKEEIKHRLKLQHKKLAQTLNTKIVYINDDDVEGMCALIIGKDCLNTFNDISNLFDREEFETVDHHASHSQVSISQKGVFVNYYSSPILDFLFGEINLKKKAKINIDRNGFSDEDQTLSFISRFEIQILSELLPALNLKCKNDEERLLLSTNFLNFYLGYRHEKFLSKSLLELFTDFLRIRTVVGDKNLITNLGDFIKNNKEFILISESENAESIARDLKKPIVIANGELYDGTFQELITIFSKLRYLYVVKFYEGKGYLHFQFGEQFSDKINSIEAASIFDTYHSIVQADSKKMFVSIWTNKDEFKQNYYDDEFFTNLNHPFVQFVISNIEAIKANSEAKKLIKSAYEYALELYNSSDINNGAIKRLNEITKPLNAISNLKKFTISDFE